MQMKASTRRPTHQRLVTPAQICNYQFHTTVNGR